MSLAGLLSREGLAVSWASKGGASVSIVRVGLAETKHFAEGYEAIFGKKKGRQTSKAKASAPRGRARKKKSKK